MILDTSFLIDVLRGEKTVEEAVRTVDNRGTAHVSSVTVMELWEGVHLADSSEDERTVVKNLLTDVRELPFNRKCAMTAGEINATLHRNGVPIEDTDVMIAATALVHDVPVVTNNVDHFERIDDLEILTY
ncbi:type II toxin-antitoxin system VapC family toxin [Natronococcus sp. JC468]|uniref:PIN domain-containing protein n=1 Tax=Natronococcus sp. JC468 TaxID=1961921 RepID=UPI001438C69C|nr:PIN domain-containing protein [Natronococcus sp. JC468]NKE35706.1 type II toxin-antitoxin system VapC family toxin [Natronococcus sp. JC468]